MANSARRGAAVLVAMVTGLLVLAGTAAAAPAGPAAPAAPAEKCGIGTAKGDGVSTLDGKPVSFDFTVCEDGPAATDTTGRFGPRGKLLGPSGPVRCADLNEHTMAFLYSVDGAGAVQGKQVLVVVSDGGPQPGDDRIGVTEPRPAKDFDGCGLGSDDAQEVTRSWQPLTEGDITVRLRLM